MSSLEISARQSIDRQLRAAGWTVIAPGGTVGPSQPTALCELSGDTGRADYVLYLDGKACGIIEAKRSDHSLQGVQEQSATYAAFRMWSDPDTCWQNPLPFRFEANGQQTQFTDARDPEPRARNIFHFPRPEHLRDLLTKWHDRPGHDPHQPESTTLRTRLHALPEAHPLDTFLATASKPRRDCQHEAITNLEASLARGDQRALIHMATGAGKTFTAITQVYRLIKFAKLRRVLFLVDRKSLGTQAEGEFKDYQPPDDGRLTSSALSSTPTERATPSAKRSSRGRGTTSSAVPSKTLIGNFRNSPEWRIAVTVDMVATGTDLKPLECLIFLRDVRSELLYTQMKGRGCRTIKSDDLPAVTPDAPGGQKTHFVLIDAVGVEESEKLAVSPADRRQTIGLRELIDGIVSGEHSDSEDYAALARRLRRLAEKARPEEIAPIEQELGRSLPDWAGELAELGRDPAAAGPGHPSAEPEQTLAPLAIDSLREKILALRGYSPVLIDILSQDTADPPEPITPRRTIESFAAFLSENRDRLLADIIKSYIALNGAFATEDPEAYRDAWEGVDSRQANALAVANKAFDNSDLKPIIEELNNVLVD